MSNSTKMNPQICTVEVGIRSLREETLYPLSVSDQFKLTSIITEVVQKVSSLENSGDDDMAVVSIAVEAIETNIAKILEFVLDDNSSISFDELTNTQLMTIVDSIFETNYENIIKNLRRLLEKAKLLWSSAPSSPKSVEKQPTD